MKEIKKVHVCVCKKGAGHNAPNAMVSGALGRYLPYVNTSLKDVKLLLLCVGCLMSQQNTGISQGRIFTDKCTCCHAEIEVAIELSISPGHSILTAGQPVQALTL